MTDPLQPNRRRAHRADLGNGTARAAVPSEGPQIGDPILRRASSITPRAIDWEWRHRFARGMVSCIAGEPGKGKSTTIADLIARATTGAPWPDGSPNTPAGGVVMFAGEDDPETVTIPRLIRHGADLDRVTLCDGVVRSRKQDSGEIVPGEFTLHDLPALCRAIEQTRDCRGVYIDPVSAYMGDTNADKNAEVRALLAPVVTLARSKNVPVVLVSHLNKTEGRNAINRVIGSIGLVALCRTVWLVLPNDDNRNARNFVCGKSNIGPLADGLSFSFEPDTGRLLWADAPVTATADELINPPRGGRDAPKLDQAEEWLHAALTAAGSAGVPATEVYTRAEQAGIKAPTLERAKRHLRVVSRRQGFGGPHHWLLPEHVDPFPIPV